jgi:hypothetical protein
MEEETEEVTSISDSNIDGTIEDTDRYAKDRS